MESSQRATVSIGQMEELSLVSNVRCPGEEEARRGFHPAPADLRALLTMTVVEVWGRAGEGEG